jgi:hypothetical protein
VYPFITYGTEGLRERAECTPIVGVPSNFCCSLHAARRAGTVFVCFDFKCKNLTEYDP